MFVSHHVALVNPKTTRMQPINPIHAGSGCAQAKTVKELYLLLFRL
jgi:hypothetical protein